ncbi:MAG: beta-ketoacyl-[acyl-carrier-protein] synthase family protein [Kiritimatiellia bacterium]
MRRISHKYEHSIAFYMKSAGNRVVITGMGILAPNGNSLDAFWRNTLNAVSGIAEITRFPIDDFPVKIAGEVKNFNLERFVPTSVKVKPKRMGLHTQFGIAATHMAIRHAGLSIGQLKDIEPIGVFLGVSTSAIDVIEKGKEVLMNRGPSKVSPYIVGACQPHAVVSEIVGTLGIATMRRTLASACPAGLESIANALEYISTGQGNIVICGGVDAPITPLTMASFHLSGMIRDHNRPPHEASRPFDADRQGGLPAEGAGIFVVESLRNAQSRGALPLAEIIGYGNFSDNFGAIPGEGLTDSMQISLDNAGILPEDIDYINAHGPSDPIIDRMETENIKKIFGNRAYRIPVSSIKGVTGNPLAAAGPMQVAATVMGMNENRIPPTANYHTPDPDCDLYYVPNRPIKSTISRAMINLHGLGGGNSTLILKHL